MNFIALLLVAGGATFACLWLLTYVPLTTKSFGKYWSPRISIVKNVLGPFDAGITMFLVAGGWIGITSALGISAMIYNVLSGIGLSVGVVIAKKIALPIWERQHKQEVIELSKKALL